MKNLFLVSILLITIIGYTQTSVILDHNNVAATINTNVVLFNNDVNNSVGYEIPKNSGNHAIYSSSFWFGGVDINGQLRLAAQKYTTDNDFSTGPLSTFGGSTNTNTGMAFGDAEITPSQITEYNRTWTVTCADIQSHILQNGTSQSILEWPAHGDVSLGQDFYLAPFYDNPNGPNGANGIYAPLVDGDYPLIRGNKATYMIFNDKGNTHSSGGEPIGLEIHMMIYQYNTYDFLNNTTFVNLRVINRSTQFLSPFKLGSFTDPSIGDYNDDFVGCHPSKNLIYAYNSDNNDLEYGQNPPAIGVISLNNSVDVAGHMNNQSNNSAMHTPETASEYWGYMNAEWGNSGVHFTDSGTGFGGTISTNYIYSDINTWSEVSESNVGGDRQMFLATESTELVAGDLKEYDFAFIYSRDGDNLQNVNDLFDVADSVQAFFDNGINTCDQNSLLSNNDIIKNSPVVIYPNPANNQFKIDLDGVFDIEIYSISGQLITIHQKINRNKVLETPSARGVYFIKISQNGQYKTEKLIVE
ncbi:MAG: T9SS type A sorting domain-containing protein [Crocinitomicaceae bacterium]